MVLLCNGTSFLYELLRKQDAIADGVAHRLAGLPVRGTFEGLYAAFDVVVALVTAMQLRALWGLLRRRPRGRSWWLADQLRLPRPRLPGWLTTGWAWYAFGLAPLLVLLRGPALLGAPWPDLVHTDLGVWLLVVCGGQLLIGALRLRQGWQVAHGPLDGHSDPGDGRRRQERGERWTEADADYQHRLRQASEAASFSHSQRPSGL